MNDINKPGVLCISLLEHVIGEDWDANIEGTKFFCALHCG